MVVKIDCNEGLVHGIQRHRCIVQWYDYMGHTWNYEEDRARGVAEMKKWCTDNFGIISWKWHLVEVFKFSMFAFDHKGHAMMFKLRFG